MRFDIEEYVNSHLSKSKDVNSKNGHEMTAVCPSCGKYGGFYVNIETGKYLCNKCDFKSNSVVGLVAKVEDITWSQARQYIFEKAVQFRRKSDVFSLLDRIKALRPDIVDDEQDDIQTEPPEGFVPIYDSNRSTKWMIPKYLKKRKIKSKTAMDWGLGYCTSGRYANRLIIPIDCPNGVSWTARSMSKEVKGPKYLNPSGVDHSRLLIGWHVAMITSDIVLCEGPLDAVRLYQCHVSALALGGKVLHDEQLSQLMSLSKNSAVTVMLDSEEKTAPYEIASRLSVHFDLVYIAKLPNIEINGEKIDPGNAPKKIIDETIDNAERYIGSRNMRTMSIIELSRKRLDNLY